MTKTSIVKDIKSAGEPYNGQYGTLYGFYVTFENGDNGKYNSKSADQNKFLVGQEATYDYIPREYNGKTYYTVKPVNPQYANVDSQSGSNGTSAPSGTHTSKDESIIRQTALKAAAEIGGTPQVVIANAQLFADWVMKKGAAQATSTHQQHFQGREEPQPVGQDGLPF
jgi:hypothetical protein